MTPIEADRLESLSTYDVDGDLGLEGLVRLAAEACSAPSASVTLARADRLHLVASVGAVEGELPRGGTGCDWIVETQAPLVVGDLRADARFRCHPWVVGTPGLRAFVGVPLIGRDGLALGSLCVADVVVRDWTPAQVETLRVLAEGVVTALELRRRDRLSGLPSDVAGQGRRLRRALDQGELVTWFQPIVSLETAEPHALEALVRWDHPQRGIVEPRVFLPAVDGSGLSLPVGRHVLHSALRTLADLRSSSLLCVAVNISPLQLAQPGLAASILADLEAHRLEPSCLAVEVTERGLSADVARRELLALREAGVWVSLDDFGAGGSSLRDLIELPLTTVKIDGSLVAGLPDPRVRRVVRATVEMAADLGLAVIAEGVETDAQRAALVEVGCELGQGHLFSPARPVHELLVELSRLSPERVVERVPAGTHQMVLSKDDLVAESLDLLEAALRAPGPVVLMATVPHRVAIERALAVRGVNCVVREGYSVMKTEDLLTSWESLVLPEGATVWSDLPSELWGRGDVAAALAVEDFFAESSAAVVCGHEHWTFQSHGTPEQVRRLHERHGAVYVPAPGAPLDALRPDARDLVHRMHLAGASLRTIAAALTAEGHPSPSGVRWHWRQVERLLDA